MVIITIITIFVEFGNHPIRRVDAASCRAGRLSSVNPIGARKAAAPVPTAHCGKYSSRGFSWAPPPRYGGTCTRTTAPAVRAGARPRPAGPDADHRKPPSTIGPAPSPRSRPVAPHTRIRVTGSSVVTAHAAHTARSGTNPQSSRSITSPRGEGSPHTIAETIWSSPASRVIN